MVFMTENAAHEAFQKTDGGKALNTYHTKMKNMHKETNEAIFNYEKEHDKFAPMYMYACNTLAESAKMAAESMYNAAFETWLDACEHKIAERGDEW